MGSIFRYSGLTTKISAMRGKLFSREEIEELSGLSGINELVEALKKRESYRIILEGTDETDIHRGDLERIMMLSVYYDFSKIYKFANMSQRAYLKLYFLRLEIDILKKAVRNIAQGKTAGDFKLLPQVFRKYSEVDFERLGLCSNFQDFKEVLKNTIYDHTVSVVMTAGEPTGFDFELAFDVFFFGYSFRRGKRQFKGTERKHVLDSFGIEADILNIMWIYRARKYYKMQNAQIYSMIIPVYYKIKKEQIKQLTEASGDQEFFKILKGSYYGRGLTEDIISGKGLDRFYSHFIEKCYDRIFRLDPYSVAVLNTYMSEKMTEVKRLVTVAECIRYKYPQDMIIKQIL